MADDIVDRIRFAETAPLDADGKVALFLVLQDARAEIARLREEREQSPRGWLTDEVRLALMDAADRLHNYDSPGPRHSALVIRRFLEGTPDAPPRGWLTSEERAQLTLIGNYLDGHGFTDWAEWISALLARSTPPKVRRPRPTMVGWDTIEELFARHDDAWIAAIREAGGEVQDG